MITGMGFSQIIFFLLILILTIKPMGWYIAQVYSGSFSDSKKFSGKVESLIYKLCMIKDHNGMDWKKYLRAFLIFNLLSVLFIYFIQRLQFYIPFNPQSFVAPSADLAFNTATSFVTNTNWQAYAGETTMSYLTQMLALTSQNFISAASGMAVLMAFIRGLTKSKDNKLGNFWVDLIRGILYIFLPLSIVLALGLVSQGVIQNLKPNFTIAPYENILSVKQTIPMGPVASQVAIKQLGTNGGGFFNTNSAHPFENPNPISNFLENLAILLIPAACCYAFGLLVNDRRQGLALLTTMLVLFIPFLLINVVSEQTGNPAIIQLGVKQAPIPQLYPGGNMEGKETRFGITSSSIWAVSTTASSNGSVNSMLDSYMPLGGLIPLWMMHLEEVVFGGVGSGLYGMLMFVIITVFVSGLMVGRSPEYLGKKIEPFEMKMASFTVLIIPLFVLLGTAFAAVTKYGVNAIANPQAHGFTEILYAFTSYTNNNGSSFSGLATNSPFFNIIGGFIMLITRYWIAIPTLAIAGSLIQKKKIPKTSGTLPTYTPLFVGMLLAVIIIIGALSFLPALALGPIVEHLMLWGKYG